MLVEIVTEARSRREVTQGSSSGMSRPFCIAESLQGTSWGEVASYFGVVETRCRCSCGNQILDEAGFTLGF